MAESRRSLGSNLARLDATTDEEIARQIAEDPDAAPELTEDDLEHAELWEGNRYIGPARGGRPRGSGTREMVTLRLDKAVLAHFRAGGPGWQTRLNDALVALVAERPEEGAAGFGGATQQQHVVTTTLSVGAELTTTRVLASRVAAPVSALMPRVKERARLRKKR
jgi:uncharacterized protein (DUF4415 family)